ncbi:MAG: WYL domain-containing protein [Actinobacteria bacterium]|nr:WYL domain-containing protein [Actinomycetota bacterium]
MTEEAYGRLGRRLRRILLMLPYAIKHPGVSVDELSKKFGVQKRDLLEDLNLVYMCGLPGYGPGDLIDVSFEDDRVYVRMADYFSAPLRLSPAEALSLYAGGAALASLPDMNDADALRSALEKLGRALGADGDRLADVTVHLEEGASEHLGVVQEALREGRRIHLEYLSASRGVLTERDVDPWGLIAALGYWYIVGLDHDSGEERMFRTDRIKAVSLTSEDAPVPEDFEPDRYQGAFVGKPEGQAHLVMEISPDAMRWFEDYYPVVSKKKVAGGWHRVELLTGGERWAATLLLRLGAEVRKISPEAFAEGARELAGTIIRRHS